MKIRLFRSADLPTLYEIDRACFPPGVSYSKREIAGFVSRRAAQTWVAEDAGHIVGFLIAGRESQEVGHIVTIDVIAEYRGQGVGRTLMDAAERWAAGLGLRMIVLETAEDNIAAQRFYEAHGYFKTERIPGYYADGTAAWLMAKTIKPVR